MASTVSDDALALQRLFFWEKTTPERVALTQPLGGGVVRDYTWRETVDQARRMAAHLRSLDLPAGSRIAILSKNTAHWLMADFAIWIAGHVSVPLYPTLAAGTIRQILEHSEAKLLFVGKLDGWDGMKAGIPETLPCVALPLSPKVAHATWDSITERTEPLTGPLLRAGDELATIMYTSGTTGAPKGVMHSFATFAWSVQSGLKRVPAINHDARMLSYLPLSHVAERTLVEHGQLATGMHVYFAESLETFTADLQRARPTVFFSVPRLWVKFQQGIGAKMPPAKLVGFHKPDLLLLDLALSDSSGIEVARKVKKLTPETKVLIVTGNVYPGSVANAFAAGADGFVLKHEQGSELLDAIQAVLSGRQYISQQVSKSLDSTANVRASSLGLSQTLTQREQQIVRMIAKGGSNQEIADALHISVLTARKHRQNVMLKLGLHNGAEIAAYAMQSGLAEAPDVDSNL